MSDQNTVNNDTTLAQENTALRNKVTVLEEQLSLMQEQLAWLKKQVFGRKTEQTSVIMGSDMQLSFFPVTDDKNSYVTDKTITVPEHKRKKKRTHDEWMSALPVEEVLHKEDNPKCDKCGSDMTEIGEDKYDELIYTPAKFHIRRHIVKVYKCIKCGTALEISTEPCNIRRAEHPELMIPGSYCSPELLAHIIYEKFCKAVPLHRQEKDFKSKGIPLLKATMSNWVCYAAEKWCSPIMRNMKEKLLSEKIIHADETVFQVLHENGRKATTDSRMWVYCNGKINDRSNIIFDYHPTRKSENAVRFLGEFDGFLVCDGYAAYNALQKAKRCGCLTHVRRYWVNALPKEKSAYETSAAAKGVDFCNRIYHEEKLLTELPAEERYEQRLVKIKPLLDAFFAWAEELQVSGKNKLVDAVRYTLNEKKYLYTFLKDGDVPIDNNRAENAIRPFTVGRKNWLFNNTERGAKCSAFLYSIISTAQANGMDVEKYLTDLFSNSAGTILLPWNN